jgi:hypothetical protein
MPASAKYDAKRKKIVIEIDYDHAKDYPDNRPEGKSKALDSNGNSRKIEGAPDNVWYMAAIYEKKGKGKGVKPTEKSDAKSKEPVVTRTQAVDKMLKGKKTTRAAKPGTLKADKG